MSGIRRWDSPGTCHDSSMGGGREGYKVCRGRNPVFDEALEGLRTCGPLRRKCSVLLPKMFPRPCLSVSLWILSFFLSASLLLPGSPVFDSLPHLLCVSLPLLSSMSPPTSSVIHKLPPSFSDSAFSVTHLPLDPQ